MRSETSLAQAQGRSVIPRRPEFLPITRHIVPKSHRLTLGLSGNFGYRPRTLDLEAGPEDLTHALSDCGRGKQPLDLGLALTEIDFNGKIRIAGHVDYL